MKMAGTILSVVLAMVPILGLNLLAGCGDRQEPTAPESMDADPRVVSPQALIDYSNSLTRRDPVNFSEFVQLLYAENNLQRRLIQGYKTALPVLDLSTAVRQRFNESLIEDSDNFTTKPSREPARIVENDGERAEAVYVDATGRDGRIYLVKIGDRWWISGYTLEYDPLEKTDPQSMAKSEAYVELYAAVSPGLLRRLHGGEFETIQQFRAALGAAMREHMQQDPDKFRIFFNDD